MRHQGTVLCLHQVAASSTGSHGGVSQERFWLYLNQLMATDRLLGDRGFEFTSVGAVLAH